MAVVPISTLPCSKTTSPRRIEITLVGKDPNALLFYSHISTNQTPRCCTPSLHATCGERKDQIVHLIPGPAILYNIQNHTRYYFKKIASNVSEIPFDESTKTFNVYLELCKELLPSPLKNPVHLHFS